MTLYEMYNNITDLEIFMWIFMEYGQKYFLNQNKENVFVQKNY